MAQALVCDKCGKVITEFGKMRHIEITPYVSVKSYSCSMTVTLDLCEECSQHLLDIKKKEKDE